MELTPQERVELEARSRSRTIRAGEARVARLLLMLADGETYDGIQERLGCNRSFISRWKGRFLEERLGGLYTRNPGRKAEVLTPKMEARILAWTRKKPTDGTTHWSTRRLAKKLGVSHMLVARVWNRAGIQPHRMRRYMRSTDPDFEAKAADVIGLYLHPPQHAAVFCVDEKTAIQALDRRDPRLPLSPGRAERHGFEYKRNGTLSLYAALNTQTGEVLGRTEARHTSQQFIAFMEDLVASQPVDQEIHVILDNLSAHKTKRTAAFLERHPNVHLHYTPTYSSWLNQVELFFSKIARDVVARGIFTSVKDLAAKLMNYIRRHNDNATPVKWKYDSPKRRMLGPTSNVTVH